jgi:hypothetical protein
MGRYVKYVGTSHWRRMTRQEWANIPEGAIEQETLEWNAANGWTIPADRITDAAWPYIKADGEFVVVDSDLRAVTKDDAADLVEIRGYPPLTTAGQAELLDQASGSVSVDAEE